MNVAETRVREELWTSFASLLRSYLAAHGLQYLGEDQAHVEISGTGIILRRGQRSVELNLDRATGQGVWHINSQQDGKFTLAEDGTMRFEDGRVEQMDMAAEHLARTLYAMK